MNIAWEPLLITAIITLLTIVVSMSILVWVVIRLPEDYLYRHSSPGLPNQSSPSQSIPHESSPHKSTQPLLASEPPTALRDSRPSKTLWQTLRHIAQWGLGIVLIAAGLLMLFLPGQGLLTILLGLMLIEFPGKQKLLSYGLKKLGSDASLKKINQLRAYFHRPAMQPPYR